MHQQVLLGAHVEGWPLRGSKVCVPKASRDETEATGAQPMTWGRCRASALSPGALVTKATHELDQHLGAR